MVLLSFILSHDQDTIHAKKGCVEMCDFRMAALMVHTGHGARARTHAHAQHRASSEPGNHLAYRLMFPKPLCNNAPHC